MDALFRKHDRLLANTSMKIIREKMDQIHWNAQIVSIIGPKGVGKSTLIKQHIKQKYKPGDRSVLYCSADTVDFSTRTLVGLAEDFYIHGGELLAIDEIHKYRPGTMDWSREVKEIYELFPSLKLVVSGSSLLHLREGDADLSRRAVKYTMPGLSFREALKFYHGLDFPKWTLEDILSRPYELWELVTSKCKPIVLFKEYLEIGRDTVVEYLKYLGDAKVFNLLYSDKKKMGKLSKPDKVYMENPNLLHALAPGKVDVGTARECFAINSLTECRHVEYGKTKGDFKVDGRYTFEIGGRSKDFSQIAGVPDSYIFADDWDMPDGAKLPLWMLGFLY